MTAKKRVPKSNVIDLKGFSANTRLGFHIEPWTSPSGRLVLKIEACFLQAPIPADRLHAAMWLRGVADLFDGTAGAALFGEHWAMAATTDSRLQSIPIVDIQEECVDEYGLTALLANAAIEDASLRDLWRSSFRRLA